MAVRGIRGRWRLLAAIVAVVLVAGACTEDPKGTPAAARAVADLPSDAPPADFSTAGSVEQVHVTGAEPGQELALHDADGTTVDVADADDQGSLIFRLVEPGDDYRVATAGAPVVASDAVHVDSVDSSLPEQDFYDSQQLDPGFTYITTRDGTTLSASVYLPGPAEDGPYPTVVEYSGYDPSRPGSNLLEENAEALRPIVGDDPSALCGVVPFACNAPAQPSSLLALAMGYAVVAVNVRGTGCSGGAYDFFETLQLTDGYDVIETVAAQPWVKGHRVGMVGLSYPGIAQLYVASMQPPSLAAITPLSVIDDTVRGTLAPGGIFNAGFALSWAEEVGEKAEPFGQGWEQAQVDAGDQTCEENQRFRGQNVDASAKAQEHRYYPPELADPLNASLFADQIDVPVFLTGSFQDEQTGGRFPLLFDKFTNAPVTHFTAMNGAHADGYAPVNLTEWKTFLDLYVADEITPIPGSVQVFAPLIMQQIFAADVSLPDERFLDAPSPAAARAEYEAEPPINVLLESGAGDPDQPGAPVPTVQVRTTQWPPPGTEAEPFYLGPDGTLTSDPPEDEEDGDGASRFAVDPELAERTTFSGSTGDIFHALPEYDWQQEPDGSAAVFVSEPFGEDQVFAGSASADLWIRTNATGADVGVTLSEVRPDGKETFIQSGVLRAANRKVAEGSTDLLPLHSQLESDAEPLERNEWAEARVEVFPFAHIVRAGSRIRLSVHTPGGDRPRWSYIIDQQPDDTRIDVGHSAEHPSKLVLPLSPDLLRGTPYPAALPPCPGLRGQPCRDFVAYENEEVDDQG
ncbi:CocE/NonD family hydrolase [Dermatobacter hominis]|uniref:CocE/NonD family hydrolase n=1 Tax=Dermatobacter hominis TaxID=2884263 RepID=UPI001D0FCB79|nr:CocE/NonD family hydrolase [Dermatobacter hominis]UDY36777.1 CocE/NonD family hydrolase [Dermatobacter hominis]